VAGGVEMRKNRLNIIITFCLYILTLSGSSRESSDTLRSSQEFAGVRGRSLSGG